MVDYDFLTEETKEASKVLFLRSLRQTKQKRMQKALSQTPAD
jgi:hypothetical protein